MAEYAKDVLVTTEWLAEHLSDASVVLAEVDEDPDPYEGGHIVGAVKLHWRDDLQDPLERDLLDREAFERLRAGSASPTRARSCSTATRTTGSRRSPTGT